MQGYHGFRCSVLAVLMASTALGGCAVGPDFTEPTAAMGSDWGTHGNRLHTGLTRDAPDNAWWEQFGDPLLSSLIGRMADSNLDLQAASSRLEQSLAISGGVAAAGLPQLSASGSASRVRNSENGLLDPSGNNGQAPYSVWQGGLQSSWELDLWGRVKREREAADARTEAAYETRHAVLLSLTSLLAQDYIRLRGVQDDIRITRENLALATHRLRLTRLRQAEGVATRLEIEQVAAQVAEIEALLPGMQQRAAELINAIGLLLVTPPQALADELQLGEAPASAPIPGVTLAVAVGLPSQLAARRPDIRRAAAALHAATADIGVAESDFYPRITLSGSVTLQSMQLSDFGSWGSRGFAIGPGFSLPLFDGGKLRAMVRLRNAQQQEAALQYRKTVLSAWHEVDNAMAAWHADAATRDRFGEALAHSRAAFDDAQLQYAQGTVDYLHVLNTQATLLRNQRALSGSRVAVSLALVDLYRSLGGGWQQDRPSAALQFNQKRSSE
jgi:NodT family efflux transporter outer membrane factor (OMF) lipoprotein